MRDRLDIQAVRDKLRGKTGQRYWRTLEEVADTPEFEAFLADEFPNRATLGQINRRDLLKFMGASLALAGLSGCRSVFLPADKVVPYVRQPEELVEGVPLYYASALALGGYAEGVLVRQNEGRPTKIEGNPEHPASLGASGALIQADLLNLYDPDRASGPQVRMALGASVAPEITTWPAFYEEATKALAKNKTGEGVRLLTGAVTSPTLAGLLKQFLAKYPKAQWHSYEAVGRAHLHEGTRLAFGRSLDPVYDFSKAKVVLTLDANFLDPAETPGSLRYARDFMDGRRIHGKAGVMNRLYVIESTPTITGITADHRYSVKASQVLAVAQAILSSLAGIEANSSTVKDLAEIVKDLQANKGAALVVAGEHQPAEVHAIAQAINVALGAVGSTVHYSVPVETNVGVAGDISSLTSDLNAGKVDTLLILGGNPVYDAPADLKFADAIVKAKLKVHLSFIEDETSALCDWQLPLSHGLEAWGDLRAYDGTPSVVQPIISPIWDSRSEIELLGELLNKGLNGYDLVREHWRTNGLGGSTADGFEKAWRTAVHDGLVKNSSLPVVTPQIQLANIAAIKPTETTGVEIIFRTDPKLYDGRYANNGWLQELPSPLSKVTWDNVAMIGPKFAQHLGVVDDDVVRITIGEAQVLAPVFIQPGHPDESVSVTLGYGRTAGGKVATVALDEAGKWNLDKARDEGGGFNAYLLRTSQGMGFVGGAKVEKVSGLLWDLASTQGHQPIEGNKITDERDIIREGTLAEYLKDPKSLKPSFAKDSEEIAKENLYPEQVFEWNGAQWAMTIDLNTCIGCNACVVACQSENNISTVGKVQVMRHREMHWLRIDRYYSGDADNPQATWQPVACVHCEKAPCEPVCPVAATVHSHEGLNQMIYNRCVGTRYCSNNCPYKVRRFNYLNYSDNQPNFTDKVQPWSDRKVPGPIHSPRKQGLELLHMVNNPEVTVRGRGVMEKCTYCVQRINAGRIEAKKEGREVKDGEIITACQQACPTKTIVFGNMADKSSKVSELRNDPRSYLLLEELQTRPRTSYLARLRNPNPAIPVATSTEVKG